MERLGRILGHVVSRLTWLCFPFIALLLDRTRFAGLMRPSNVFFKNRGFAVRDIPSLADKVFVVTGANVGIGFSSSKLLAAAGATVILACRSTDKAEQAKAQIVRGTHCSAARVVVMHLDNASLASVKAFSNAFLASFPRLDGLLCNAGGMEPAHALTADGFERMIGVNHVAHFALCKDLLALLESTARKQGAPTAVVFVSSIAHFASFNLRAALKRGDAALMDRASFRNPLAYYGASKLMNLLTAKELARRQAGSGYNDIGALVAVNAVHPGVVASAFYQNTFQHSKFLQGFDAAFGPSVYWSPEEAALTALAPLVSPQLLASEHGQYFIPLARSAPSSWQSMDDGLAAELWAWTEGVLRERGYTHEN